MNDILERFQRMVKEVQERPYLEVVTFTVNPPLEAAALAVVEERLGAPLTAPLREFYQAANGLEILWRYRLDLKEDEIEQLDKDYNDYSFELLDDPDNPFAHINLIPLEDAIVHRTWEGLEQMPDDVPLEFAGQTFTHRAFAQRVRPFDIFSTYGAMAFILEPGVGAPPVMLVSDYYIEWDESRLTDFESYLEMLIATRGIVAARQVIYGESHGHMQPPLLTGADYWTEARIPKLFRN